MGIEGEKRPVRFENEKKPKFKVAEGSWESVLVGLKSEYPESVFGVAETDYWEEIEEKATMDLKKACFQYFLAGVGHVTLAGRVVNSNPAIRVKISLGEMSTGERNELVDRFATFLYDRYPRKYRERIKK